MTHKEIYDPEKYDLRDSRWEFLSVQEGELTVRVDDVNILSGEGQGQVIEAAIVTFRGFHLEWLHVLEETRKAIPVSPEQARELLTSGDYFVFSYWSDNHECELAAMGDPVIAMLFAFDSAEIRRNISEN